MPSYRQRFVGANHLPKSISQTEIDEDFGLSDVDVAEIRERFRGIGRLGAAIQLVTIRATGRGLDAFTGIPRLLLQSLTKSIGGSDASIQIASLKTLYERRATRFEHQRWARDHAGFRALGGTDHQLFIDVLAQLSASAVAIDDLVRLGEIWLFEHQYILPGDRYIRDQARAAFAAQDAASLAVVRQCVSRRNFEIVLSRIFTKRKGPSGASVLEWLKSPPAKHGPRTLSETIQKVAYLKMLRVHEWDFSSIPHARRQAYSQAVINRSPHDTERLAPERKELELCCFLHVTLHELTDISADTTGRRVNDIYRFATGHVERKLARNSVDLRSERIRLKTLLYDQELSDQQKIEALKNLIPNDPESFGYSRAALVRLVLVEEESHRVSALLNSLGVFEVRGDETNPVLQQIKILRHLIEQQARELPNDFDVSIAATKWHPLLASSDRKKALAALKACVMVSVRKEIKGGKLWLAHSRSHRDREEQLIPQCEWSASKKGILRALSLTADPDKYLGRVFEKIEHSLKELAAVVEEGRVTIDGQGHMHIPAIVAADIEPEVARARDAIFEIIGPVQHGHLLVEVDAKVGFSEILLGRKAKSAQELTSVYGALLAHGTDIDAKSVAQMIPGVQVSQITAAMRALESAGRMTKANDRLADFQQSIGISKL